MSVVGGRIRARGTYASGVTDFVGLALIGLFVAWTLVTAANRGVSTRPDPVWQLAIAAAAAYAVGRAAGAVAPVLAPAALAAGVAAWFVLTPGAFSGDGGAGPLGYGNANAALLVQAVAGAGLAVVATRDVRLRPLLLGGAAVLTLAVASTSSLAGLLLAVLVLGAVLVAPGVRRREPVLLGCAAAIVLAVIATAALGSTYSESPKSGPVAGSEGRRMALWHDAVTLTGHDPLRGVGPGRFEVESTIAQADADTNQAHSAVLQESAEQGLLGGLLVLAIVGWALVALWRADRPEAVVIVGAAGVTALALHASVDYVIEFPVVVLAAAALLGVATAARQ